MVIHGIARRSARPQSHAQASPDVRPLTPGDVGLLRLDWRHRHDPAEVRRLVGAFPGRSMWIPATGEFVLIAPWRNRTDIVHIAELSAVRDVGTLIANAAHAAGERGAEMLVVVENDERRRPRFYREHGFQLIDSVISMERHGAYGLPAESGQMRFTPVRIESEVLPAIEAVDQRAFPWFWWNSHDEFVSYLTMPDVSVLAGLLDERVVSYFGVTEYAGWGHLDRIAVDPVAQGTGIGAQTLSGAITLLRSRGAGMIGLSTQADNHRSQRLYARAGFSRADADYRIYGKALGSTSIDQLLGRACASDGPILVDSQQ